MVKESTWTQSPSYRAYEIDDHDQVVEMCKNVFGGTDYVPHVLGAYHQDPSCFPRVVTNGSQVVTFCNLRALESDDDHQDVYLLEAVRVAESERGKGFGNFIVEEALRTLSKNIQPENTHTNSDKQVHLLSMTVLHNIRMRKIFDKTDWTLCGLAHLWPSHSALEDTKKSGTDINGRLLDLLKVSEFIPKYALDATTQWRQITSSGEVLQMLHQLQRVGASHLVPGYYSAETVYGASKFLCHEDADVGKRSIWKLERAGKPPALLIVQTEKGQGSHNSSHGILSACVVDPEGAECCVAFARSRKELGCFQIAFDPAISDDVIAKSDLLSAVESTHYVMYETRR